MEGERTDNEIVAGWGEGVSGTLVRPERVVHVEHVWGTAITITLVGTTGRDAAAAAAIRECTDYFNHIDQTFSPFKPLSEVALHRIGLDGPAPHSAEFLEVMHACRDIRDLTRGAFDPWTVPGGYDPSGFVKGWGAGRASELLSARGFTDHLVNAGGDICALGDEAPGSGRGWPVGIINPHDPSQVIRVVAIRNLAMATSGRYERGDHVVDPSTGRAAVAVDSATVVGPDPGLADAAASAVLVDGLSSLDWFDSLGPGWSTYLVINGVAHSYGPAFDEQRAGSMPTAGS